MGIPGCGWIKPAGRAIETLLAHLPEGVAWISWRTPDKIANKLMLAFAGVYNDAWDFLCRLIREIDPRTTTDMLTDWERALNLPDACLPNAVTVQERRDRIMFRLDKRRWTTVEDWQDLAAIFGLTIAITPGWYVQRPQLFEYQFPLGFDLFPRLGRFRVYIDILDKDYSGFEYGAPGKNANVGFPIPFGSTDPLVNAFVCMIERVRPAHVIVIWNEFPSVDARYCTRPSFTDDFAPPFC